eukprot:TRINITY_DN19707_c0_g1_i1.p1 TRINITY_DN19707_c0_g1~~TRINITY_DN19707_c0_g1_i1.p1  ORF type:complete len:185 (-),score=31.16 TRINITY_DN19707_c0_g1_i1:3-557(-)
MRQKKRERVDTVDFDLRPDAKRARVLSQSSSSDGEAPKRKQAKTRALPIPPMLDESGPGRRKARMNGRESMDGGFAATAITELSDTNERVCFYCQEGGALLSCDNCHRSFEEKCLHNFNPRLKIARDAENWFCPFCAEPTRELCVVCKKVVKPGEFKLRCSICPSTAHFEHVNVPLELLIDTLR